MERKRLKMLANAPEMFEHSSDADVLLWLRSRCPLPPQSVDVDQEPDHVTVAKERRMVTALETAGFGFESDSARIR